MWATQSIALTDRSWLTLVFFYVPVFKRPNRPPLLPLMNAISEITFNNTVRALNIPI